MVLQVIKSGLARYASLGLWTTSADYLYGSNIGVGHEQLVNALLGWEKQGMFNVGVDLVSGIVFMGL